MRRTGSTNSAANVRREDAIDYLIRADDYRTPLKLAVSSA
jgi:hypothetical protein